jgi:hypothetical protein
MLRSNDAIEVIRNLRRELMSSHTLSTCPFTLFGYVMSVHNCGTISSPMSKREDGPYIDVIRDLAIQ